MNKGNRIEHFGESVLAHIKSKDMNALKTLLNLDSTSEVEVLDMMGGLSTANQAIVYRLLTKEKALFVFERLDTSSQQRLIRSFTEEAAIEIIEELEPDERVRLFDEMPATLVKKILSGLSPEEREMTNLLMGYGVETAGHVMTPEYVRVSRNMTVAEALEKVKEHAVDKEAIYTVYVTDDARKLDGVVTLRDLLLADPAQKMDQIMKNIAAQVSTDTDQEEVARLLKKLDWLAMPVVDKENRLVGIVTINDAAQILEDEATEDIMSAAGLVGVAAKESDRSSTLTKGRLYQIWAVRLPFLLIALVGGLIAGVVIEGFEDALEAVVVVAFFIPVILDMGGSVGAQSATIFARGVVLGHISVGKFLPALGKEMLVGLSLGIICGAIAGGVILFWIGSAILALTVSLALALTMLLATLLGFLTPYITMKLRMDQAAASGPLITTIKDITGLFIYFGLIVLLMGSYLEPNYEITEIHATVDGIHFVIDPEEETAVVVGWDDDVIYLDIPEEITVGGEAFEVIGIEGDAAGEYDSDSEADTEYDEGEEAQ
ncbi:MAG: magnesium transporter [Oscillospiraceae bacterium]|nr:magnesium transporter [Oscillospiraceae bacterium]